jgi:hypothetical protein
VTKRENFAAGILKFEIGERFKNIENVELMNSSIFHYIESAMKERFSHTNNSSKL